MWVMIRVIFPAASFFRLLPRFPMSLEKHCGRSETFPAKSQRPGGRFDKSFKMKVR
jgi:hypothetical protein